MTTYTSPFIIPTEIVVDVKPQENRKAFLDVP